MKLKSFLFLTAALAVGLALAGCSTDSDDGGTTTITDYRGYAGDADAIMAAFKFADEVWLTRETDLTGQILAIPSGKTLHVDGWQVNVDDGTILAVDGTLDLNATGSIINSEKAGAVLVNVTGQLNTQEAQEAHYGSASTPYTAGTEGLVFVKNDGTPKDTETKRYIAGPASAVLGGGTYAASNADGTTSIVLGNTGTANGEYDNTGGGTLLITGDLNFGTGFVNN
ncbi:MAG: hypothetical protein LBK66_12380, partial [Spirochaetaceae bacterium]|nr:hypothetical protein [Spirochaetaceae bacterium]